MTIFIGVPCYGSQLLCQFAQCLIKLTTLLTNHKIPHKLEFLGSDSLISRARNTIVAKFYSNPEFTHLLFLDSDLMFAPEAVLQMLSADKELIGCPYPKKIYNWQKVISVLKEKETIDETLKPLLTDINYNLLPVPQNVESTLVKCKDIPTGFMLIKRSLINLSEDYYFYHLVRQLGIDCWLETAFTFGHIGKEIFYSNLGLQLQHFKNDDMNMDKQLFKNISNT